MLLAPQVRSSLPVCAGEAPSQDFIEEPGPNGAVLSLAHESAGSHGNTTGFGLAQQFWLTKEKKCTVLAWWVSKKKD